MGCATWSLTAWARAYCDAGYDAGGRFELTVLLPLLVACEAAAGLLALATGRRLALQAPAPFHRALPTLLVAVATVGPAWWFFATRGTLADYPGDSGHCPPSNIPPQWPDWLPA